MAEPDMSRLDDLLSSASQSAFPATPDLASAVERQLEAPVTPRAPQRRIAMRVAFASLAAVVALLLAVTVSRDVREAVADFLGLAVEGERIERLPTPAPGVTPTPFPTPPRLESFATPSTLSAVAATLGITPPLPASLGPPRAVYLIDYAGTPVAVFDYGAFALWEDGHGLFTFGAGAFSKGLPEQTVIDQVTVNGRPAYWIQGGPHLVRYIGPDGKEAAGSQRVVLATTLVWKGATVNYRLEGDLTEEAAVAIASELP